MFTNSRSIDDRATAASFDTAHQKYAAATDSWFDGTPFSIDNRLAQCRRLMNIARTHIARRGAEVGPLHRLAELETDARALVALREDLLTGAYDRADDSRIAGVYVANCGDDEEFEGGDHDDDSAPNDYLFDEMGRYHRDRFKGKEGSRKQAAGTLHPEHDGMAPWEEARADESLEKTADCKCWKGYERVPGTKPCAEGSCRKCDSHRKESALSPADRRYVTLESSRFLADNIDTNDARELATRAMHYAQKVTSSYSVSRSRSVTAAFVQKVADGAVERRNHAALFRSASKPALERSTDSLPPEALFF